MRLFAPLLTLLTTLVCLPAVAQPAAEPMETSRRFGQDTVHYVVFPSTFVSEKVAQSYQMVRAANRSFINVSIRRDDAEGGDSAKTAQVKGSFTDLIQSKPLQFREIREQDAIYYIAEFRHGDNEVLRFSLTVQPDPNAPAHSLTFTRKLHVER